MAGYRKDAIFVQLLLFHIAVYPIMLNLNTKGSTRRARNTQARDLASPPKKATKEPKHERQHPTSKKHPSEGFGIAPKKGKKNKQTRKAAPDEQETPKRGIWHRPQKRQGSTWLDRGNLDRFWTFWDYKMVFDST